VLSPSAIAAQKERAEVPSNIPKVSSQKIELPVEPGTPPSDDRYKGLYKNSIDGELYAVCIVDKSDARDGDKTHFAKNSEHFWNGTLAQFKDVFEKE